MNNQDNISIAFIHIIKLFVPAELNDAAQEYFDTSSNLFEAFLQQIESREQTARPKPLTNEEFSSQWRVARGLDQNILYAPPIKDQYIARSDNPMKKTAFYEHGFQDLTVAIQHQSPKSEKEWMDFVLCLQKNECDSWDEESEIYSSDFVTNLSKDFIAFLLNENLPHGVLIRNRLGLSVGDTKQVGREFKESELVNAASGCIQHLAKRTEKPEP